MRISYGEYSRALDLGKYPPIHLTKRSTYKKHTMSAMTVQGIKVRIHEGLTKNAKDQIKISLTPPRPRFSSPEEAAYVYNGWREMNGMKPTTDERLVKPLKHVNEYQALCE